MSSFPTGFAAVAPNRLHYTSGPADGEYKQIRLTGPAVLTGVDQPIPDPPIPTVAHGEGLKVDLWPTGQVVG